MVEQDNVLDLTLSLETIQLVKQKIAIIRQQEEKGRMVELLKKKLKQFGEEIVPYKNVSFNMFFSLLVVH